MMIKNGGDWMLNWLQKLHNKAFESGTIAEDWKVEEQSDSSIV